MKTYAILKCSCGAEFSTKIWSDEKTTNSVCPKCNKSLSRDEQQKILVKTYVWD